MTQEGTPYGTWQTMEAINTRDQGVSEKDQNMEHQNSKFGQKTPKVGDINYGIKVHVNDQGRNMDIQEVITLLCYYYRVELSMHSEVLDGRKPMEHLSAKDEV